MKAFYNWRCLCVISISCTAFLCALINRMSNEFWWKRLTLQQLAKAAQRNQKFDVLRKTQQEVSYFVSEEVLLKLFSFDCALSDAFRDSDVIKMTQSGTESIPFGEYKHRRAENFVKEFANPFPKNPNLPELRSYESRFKDVLENSTEEINEKEVTDHLDSVKKMRLDSGDDDPLQIPEVIKELNQRDFKIPNIVHFVYFGCLHVRVIHYLALLGALRYEKPSVILFHTNCEPSGPYWDAFKAIVKDKLKIVKRSPPQKIWNKTIEVVEHKSDVARLEIILEVGGIYLDMDAFIVRPLDDLRHYEMVLGEECQKTLANSIILSNKDAWFLKRWYWEYKYFMDDEWAHNSCHVPRSIWKIFPSTIHVVLIHMVRPNWRAREVTYFYRELMDWSKHYTFHVSARTIKKYDGMEERPLKQLAVLNTTYGEVARHIIWGDKRVRDVTDWIVTCNVTKQLIKETVL